MNKDEVVRQISEKAINKISQTGELPTPDIYEFYFKQLYEKEEMTDYQLYADQMKAKISSKKLKRETDKIKEVIDDVINAVNDHSEKVSKSERELSNIVDVDISKNTASKIIDTVEIIKDANKLLREHMETSNSILIYEAKLFEKMLSTGFTDHLTGIGMRRLLEETIIKELERVKRYNIKLSILMLDLDNFKRVNDNYGHIVGDRVLQAVANIFRTSMRSTDSVFRYGGDEFIVVLPETDSEKATITGNKILSKISKTQYRYKDSLFSITCSCGITSVSKKDSMESVLTRVDSALYEVKSHVKGGIYCTI